MTATIRPATPADAGAIAALERSSFATPGEPFHLRQIRGLVRNPRGVVLLAEDAGAALGWAAGLLRRHRSRSGESVSGRLYAVAVDPAARGQSLGRRLTVAVLDALAARGAAWIALEVREGNTPAIALYESLGFRAVARLSDYYAEGVHALRMRRP